jgi:hypothetical protein
MEAGRGDTVEHKKLLPIIGALGFCLVSSLALAQPTPLAQPTIAPGPTMNDTRYDAASALLPNGNLLIAGGGSSAGPFLDTIDIYRYKTDDFVPAANLPTMNSLRANETATTLPNGEILIAGGAVDGTTWTNTTDIFDPYTRKITVGPPMNNQREGATAALLPNGWVIIAGGRDTTNVLNTVDIYHPVTNKITVGPPMNAARYDCASVVLPNGTLMIYGGFGGVNQGTPLASTEIFNPTLKKWASAPPTMMDARGGARATLLTNGKVLITGGTNGTTGVVSTTEIYHPVKRTFTAGPDMSDPRKFHTQIRLANGQVLIAGGYSDNTGINLLNTTDIYHPVTNKITVGPPLTDARGLATGALFPNHKALVAGGSNGSTILDTTDLYTP